MKLGKYLRKSRKENSLSMAKLRDLSGVSATYIMDIEKGCIPSNQILSKLATALDLDLKNLLMMAEKERDSEAFDIIHGDRKRKSSGNTVPGVRSIPVVDYTKAQHWQNFLKEHQAGGNFDEVAVATHCKNIIALRVTGNNMEPVIRDGQIAVVDFSRKAQNGDLVIVSSNGASTIKRFHRMNKNNIILEPINPAFDKILITGGNKKNLPVVGVVIEIKLVI